MTIRTPRRPEDWLGDADTQVLTAWLDEMRARLGEGRSTRERCCGGEPASTSARASKRAELGSGEAPRRDGPRR